MKKFAGIEILQPLAVTSKKDFNYFLVICFYVKKKLRKIELMRGGSKKFFYSHSKYFYVHLKKEEIKNKNGACPNENSHAIFQTQINFFLNLVSTNQK